MRRKLIGVISTQTAFSEQSDIIRGIIAEAFVHNTDIAVISNIYHPAYDDFALNAENDIYRLLLSPDLDALILITEPFADPAQRSRIAELIRIRPEIPMVAVGSDVSRFDLPNCLMLNTSDENDIADVTAHLIAGHGFTEIDILTGPDTMTVSHHRVAGYRRALEQNGIPFDESRVIYGDFWLNSGQMLAEQYLSGRRRMPQAVVCTNDYMAFGLIDTLSKANVRIPEELTVIGYEYAQARHLHKPILTTYQRNRPALGKAAVQILLHKLREGVYSSFSPPQGTVIPGNTCACGVCAPAFTEELEAVRARADNELLHLHSRLELRLIEAKSMEDFRLAFIGQEFLLRNVQEMHLCLYANWYTEEEPRENVVSYPVYSETHESQSRIFPFAALREIIGKCRHPAAYFYTPLFFSDHPRGYVVLRYDIPTTYDPVFRNWVKAVYNALEFLRMKNDIQSLLACQNLSEYHDTLTGLFNRKGFSHALHLEIGEKKPSVFCICLQTGLRHDRLALESKLPESAAAKSLAQILNLIGRERLVTARISDQRYVLAAINLPKQMQRVLTDRLHALLLRDADCFRMNGVSGYAVVTHETPVYQSSTALLQAVEQAMEEQLIRLHGISQSAHFEAFCSARDLVYALGQPVQDIAVLCRSFTFSDGHFRRMYKAMFGLSFHQDVIRRRVLHSIALLITTELDLSAVCQRCGYENYSYFMSQFHAFTGMTPNQYRRIISAHT